MSDSKWTYVDLETAFGHIQALGNNPENIVDRNVIKLLEGRYFGELIDLPVQLDELLNKGFIEIGYWGEAMPSSPLDICIKLTDKGKDFV